MATKKITITTSKQKYYFEVDEYSSKYHLYKITYGGWLGGSKNRDKIGETKSLEDAITLAKTSTDGSVQNTQID